MVDTAGMAGTGTRTSVLGMVEVTAGDMVDSAAATVVGMADFVGTVIRTADTADMVDTTVVSAGTAGGTGVGVDSQRGPLKLGIRFDRRPPFATTGGPRFSC